MIKYNCYIVDKFQLKVKCDVVDYQNGIRVDFPLTSENIAKGEKAKTLLYLVGRKNNLYPNGPMYPAEDCFKTRKEAEAKLEQIIRTTIRENITLIENLNGENKLLYKKLEKLHGR